MKIYRHIFFKNNIIQNGTGNTDVYYYGQMYSNCEQIKKFREVFDRLLDLYIPCNDCARTKYRHFIKKTSPNK